MITNRPIIVASNISFDFRIQRPWHLLTGLANKGHKVLYVNSFGQPTFDASPRQVYNNTYSMNPWATGRICNTSRDLLKNTSTSIINACKMIEIDPKEAYIWIDIPYWEPILDHLPYYRTIYNLMDEASGFSDLDPQMVIERENKLLKRSDLILATSATLYQKASAAAKEDSVILVPNACEFDYFLKASQPSDYIPNDIKNLIDKPIIGYFGAIADWFDEELVYRLGTLSGEFNIVLIGTVTAKLDMLKSRPDIFHFLGEKPYSQLVDYLRCFNVCIIPFKINDLIKATNPVKMYEYLAAGKPVISTRIPEVVKFAEAGIAELADTGEEFFNISRYLLQHDSDELRQRRINSVRYETWSSRVDTIENRLEKMENSLPKSEFDALIEKMPSRLHPVLRELANHGEVVRSESPIEYIRRRLGWAYDEDYVNTVKDNALNTDPKEYIDSYLENYIIGNELKKILFPGAKVLDVGSSVGSYWYSPEYKITAIDIRPLAKDLPDYVEFKQGDVMMMSVEDEEFDIVNCSHIIEHIKNTEEFIRELRRVLKPGGLLYIGVPQGNGWPNRLFKSIFRGEGHINNVELEELISTLRKEGFRTVRWHEWPDDFGWLEPLPNIGVLAKPLKAITREKDHRYGTDFSRYGWAIIAKKENKVPLSNKITLSTICPILNEEFFLPLYLDSVLTYADQVILSDGGSTDRSLDIIKDYDSRYPGKITLIHHQQTGDPYTSGWNEHLARNRLLDTVWGDFILWIDIDEMMDDNFKDELPKILERHKDFNGIMGFEFYAFWEDLRTIRLNHPNDRGWRVQLYRMWRNQPMVSYEAKETHCRLMFGDKMQWQVPTSLIPNVKMFHIHYAMGQKIKMNDNRRGDVNRYGNIEPIEWDFLNRLEDGEWPFDKDPSKQYRLVTEAYSGPWPSSIKKYIEEETS